MATPAAIADTAPSAGVEETVTADPLPTAQIDGVVWTQAIAGDTVYVGGEFAAARPAGADPGANTQPRANLMAYNLTTGEMTSWNPGANAVIKTIVASPDGSRIYVGGSFTSIAGQTRYRSAAFDAATGALLPWAPYSNAQVSAIAASGDSVFLAGNFTSLGGGVRTRIGAVTASTAALLPLTSTLTGGYGVTSIVADPTGAKIVVAGSFESANGSTNPGRGMAALDAATGASLPWAVNATIRNAGTKAAMTALTSDADSVYGTGYDFGGAGADKFEGTFRANWSDGSLVWIEDCHGDNYSVAASGGVVFVASHDHYCGNIGGFPETSPKRTFHHSLAFAKEYHGNVLTADIYGYKSYTGQPAATGLHWYPDWQVGMYTGKSQATWDVVANDDYVLYGGEFLKVNNQAQQGLVRFAKKSIAPSKSGPENSGTTFPITASSLRADEVRLAWTANTDRDNQTLTYQVFRQDKGSTPIHTVDAASNFWTTPRMSYVDKSAVAGTTYQYRVRAIDPMGNQATGAWTSIEVASTNQATAYSRSVIDDGAVHYWPLNETSGTVGTDWTGAGDVTVKGATRGVVGPNQGEPGTASSFAGSSGSIAATSAGETSASTVSVEAWFKTSSTKGGKLIGFGNKASGSSSLYDRQIYLSNVGRVSFGVNSGSAGTVSSDPGLNNNEWHHVVGTLSEAGISLYVDGSLVGTQPNTTTAKHYGGYWRVAGDAVGSWPNAGTSSYLNAAISDVAVYDVALTGSRVNAHWVASGRTSTLPNAAPVAAFTSLVSGLDVSVDGSSTTDADGTVADYAWDFGDSATATGATASHTYAAAGTFDVTLTVTDDKGATNVKTAPVTMAAAPPGNTAPVAAFTSVVSGLGVAVDGSSSSDADGTIAGYAWNFGDSATATGATASHTYAAAGTFTVTLTVTDDKGATNVKTAPVTVTAPPPPGGNVLASDLFERTGTNGWGTADQGGAWSVYGSGSRYSVSGGAGVFTLTSSTSMSASLPSVSSSNTQLTAEFSVDKIANAQYISMIGRQVGSDQYLLRTRVAADGSVQLYVLRNSVAVGGAYTVPGLTIVPGEKYTVSFEVTGTSPTTLNAKIWKSSDAEPAAWQLQRTDNTAALQAPGSVGVFSYVPNSANAYPVKLAFDSITITDPTIP